MNQTSSVGKAYFSRGSGSSNFSGFKRSIRYNTRNGTLFVNFFARHEGLKMTLNEVCLEFKPLLDDYEDAPVGQKRKRTSDHHHNTHDATYRFLYSFPESVSDEQAERIVARAIMKIYTRREEAEVGQSAEREVRKAPASRHQKRIPQYFCMGTPHTDTDNAHYHMESPRRSIDGSSMIKFSQRDPIFNTKNFYDAIIESAAIDSITLDHNWSERGVRVEFNSGAENTSDRASGEHRQPSQRRKRGQSRDDGASK